MKRRNCNSGLRALVFAAALLGALGAMNPSLAQPATDDSARQPQAPAAGVVNINAATVTELMRLPGVGEAKARAIIARREQRAFQRVEEIMRVKGIGRATFRRLRPMLSIEGETTLGAKP